MKAPVIRAFRDKTNNGKYVKAKSVYEGTEERIKELQEKGFCGKEVENSADTGSQEPSILDGNVEEVKKNADGLTIEEVKELLEIEKSDKNRSGVVKHFESLIEAAEGKPPEEGE